MCRTNIQVSLSLKALLYSGVVPQRGHVPGDVGRVVLGPDGQPLLQQGANPALRLLVALGQGEGGCLGGLQQDLGTRFLESRAVGLASIESITLPRMTSTLGNPSIE